MSAFMCGQSVPIADDLPDAGEGLCCIGSAVQGPTHCTCWEPVYDLEQAEPDTTWGPPVRSAPCGDCAYRPDSPERLGSDHVQGNADLLEELVQGDNPFFCHDGIRRPVRWEHRSADGPPTGVSVPGSEVNYSPPIIDGVPYRANGQPAFICAGWDMRRGRVLMEQEA